MGNSLAMREIAQLVAAARAAVAVSRQTQERTAALLQESAANRVRHLRRRRALGLDGAELQLATELRGTSAPVPWPVGLLVVRWPAVAIRPVP
jgi:hypothetical protein